MRSGRLGSSDTVLVGDVVDVKTQVRLVSYYRAYKKWAKAANFAKKHDQQFELAFNLIGNVRAVSAMYIVFPGRSWAKVHHHTEAGSNQWCWLQG